MISRSSEPLEEKKKMIFNPWSYVSIYLSGTVPFFRLSPQNHDLFIVGVEPIIQFSYSTHERILGRVDHLDIYIYIFTANFETFQTGRLASGEGRWPLRDQ